MSMHFAHLDIFAFKSSIAQSISVLIGLGSVLEPK